jgi:hypothetical protein
MPAHLKISKIRAGNFDACQLAAPLMSHRIRSDRVKCPVGQDGLSRGEGFIWGGVRLILTKSAIVSTASDEARYFGIHSGMSLLTAHHPYPRCLPPGRIPYLRRNIAAHRIHLARFSRCCEDGGLDEESSTSRIAKSRRAHRQRHQGTLRPRPAYLAPDGVLRLVRASAPCDMGLRRAVPINRTMTSACASEPNAQMRIARVLSGECLPFRRWDQTRVGQFESPGRAPYRCESRDWSHSPNTYMRPWRRRREQQRLWQLL